METRRARNINEIEGDRAYALRESILCFRTLGQRMESFNECGAARKSIVKSLVKKNN
jgi:hypothetical protein